MADGKKDILGYEKLYEISRLEKRRDELQKLDPGFLDEAGSLIRLQVEEVKKYELASDIEGTAKGQIARRELDNIRRILKEIYDRRESKIIDMAITKTRTATHLSDTSLMMPEEKRFYEEMISMLSDYRRRILDPVSMGEAIRLQDSTGIERRNIPLPEKKEPEKPKALPDKVMVRFIEPVPQFVGEDLEVLGPFKEGSAMSLPTYIAEVLIERKKAERVR